MKDKIPDQTETQVVNSVLNYLRELPNVKAWRNNTAGIYSVKKKTFMKNKAILKGVPDILGWVTMQKTGIALFLGIECKTKTGTISQDQSFFIADAVEAHAIVFIARGVDDVIREFDRLGIV